MKLLRQLSGLFRRSRLDAEMTAEMQAHVDLQTERNVAAGMKPEDARYAALRQFGNVASVQERCREQRRGVALELAGKELGFALRSLRRAPGFSLAVLATLALCIGPNTAILSTLYTLVLKPLPFAEPDRLVSVSNVAEKDHGRKYPSNVAQYLDFKANADRFEGFSLVSVGNSTVGEDSAPARVTGMGVNTEFFSLLRLKPVLGRFFTDEERVSGRNRVLVLTQGYWETAFQADPNVVGREVLMNSEPYTIIGVAPRSFEDFYTTIRFFTPFSWAPSEETPQARTLTRALLLGRLRDGVTLAEGRNQLEAIERRFRQEVAPPSVVRILADRGSHIGLGFVREELAEPVRTPLLLLQAAALFVLLIGCVNVTNLLLARANAKRAEFTIRHALGAGKAVLVRQMLAESLLLTAAAALIGTALAWGILQVMNRYVPIVVHEAPVIRLDLSVLGMTIASATGIALLLGLLPFALLWREGLNLGAARTASTGRTARLLSNSLIVAQVAVALLLLTGAGLMVRSFAKVMAVTPGFDAAHVIQGRVALPLVKYSNLQDNVTLQQQVIAAMREIPGVESAAMVADFGIAKSFNLLSVTFRDTAVQTGGARPLTYQHWVSPDYFDTMGIRLLEGRAFNEGERVTGVQVAGVIVDQAFAERYFPGRSAIGQEIAFNANNAEVPWTRIIGVAARAQLTGLEGRDGYPFIYLPLNQRFAAGFTLLLRTERPVPEVLVAMRERLRAIDPTLPLYSTGVLQQGIEDMLLTRRAVMVLLTGFAGLALLLAGVGLYGVLAYDVSQRTREIGIRGALGASRAQIVGLVLRQGVAKALLGLGGGLAGAFNLTRLLRGMLFDTQAADPLTFAAVSLLLLLVALLASWLPARRAAEVDPVVALRAE